NLHELLPPELTRDRPKDTSPDGIPILIDQHAGIPIKLDVGTILATYFLGGPHDYSAAYIALLDCCRRNGLFDTHDDNVSERGLATPGPTKHMKAHGLLGTGVIGHVHIGIALNHSPGVKQAMCRSEEHTSEL